MRKEDNLKKGQKHLESSDSGIPLSGKSQAEAADDIKANGQREDITTLDGMILDGRNRYRACELDSNEPKLIEYDGNDPLAFVLSKNLKRRHLSESQRAMIAASLAKIEHGHNRYENKSKVDVGIPTSTQAKAAKALNVSRDSVIQARKVQDHGTPELTAAIGESIEAKIGERRKNPSIRLNSDELNRTDKSELAKGWRPHASTPTASITAQVVQSDMPGATP